MLDCAEAVIRREGASASIEAIAAEAGVTKPIVYARVGGRAELANALAERLTLRMTDASQVAVAEVAEGVDALTAMFRVALAAVGEHRELFLYVTAGNSPGDRLSMASLIVEPMIEQIAVWGEDHEVDRPTAEAWAYAIVGMLNFVALWWATEGDRDADELAAQLADLVWNGFDRA